MDRFHKIFPESEGYAKMHNFNFYQITIIQARWIGGFGKISWLDPELLKEPCMHLEIVPESIDISQCIRRKCTRHQDLRPKGQHPGSACDRTNQRHSFYSCCHYVDFRPWPSRAWLLLSDSHVRPLQIPAAI